MTVHYPARYTDQSGSDVTAILCVEHVTAERCYNEPGMVVAEFLGVLSQHRR